MTITLHLWYLSTGHPEPENDLCAEVSLCSGVEINSDYGISAISKVIQKLHTTELQLPKVALAQ